MVYEINLTVLKKKLLHIILFTLGLSFVLETGASAIGFVFDTFQTEEVLDVDSEKELTERINDFSINNRIQKPRLKSISEVIVSSFFVVERYFPSIKKTAYYDLCIFHESFLL